MSELDKLYLKLADKTQALKERSEKEKMDKMECAPMLGTGSRLH